jgi:hypothetical protein
MKLTILTMAVAAACVIAQSAEARTYHHHAAHYRHEYRHYVQRHEYRHVARRYGHARRYAAAMGGDGGAWGYQGWSNETSGYGLRRTAYRGGSYRGGLGGRPAAWCGWYMRKLLGVADPSYNLARNWAHWGHGGAPGVGAVVVWAHHVGKIVGREGGEWVIQSGNDGHAVRTRPRSIAGAIAFRWG